mgnify:FL=1
MSNTASITIAKDNSIVVRLKSPFFDDYKSEYVIKHNLKAIAIHKAPSKYTGKTISGFLNVYKVMSLFFLSDTVKPGKYTFEEREDSVIIRLK